MEKYAKGIIAGVDRVKGYVSSATMYFKSPTIASTEKNDILFAAQINVPDYKMCQREND